VEACSGSCDWGELDALAVTHTTVETFAVESADDEDDASEDTEPDSASEDADTCDCCMKGWGESDRLPLLRPSIVSQCCRNNLKS